MSSVDTQQNTVNQDPAEIEKFSQLAHKWWDMDSEFRPLHEINPLRLSFITEYADLLGKDVVDVGCGGGILTEALAKSGASHVLGVDLAQKSLKVAQLHALETELSNVSYECIPVEALAENKPAQFGVVTCMEMLEHVPDAASVVRACANLVEEGGYVFFSTLNRNPKSYVQAIIGAEYLLKLMPKGTHDYKKFITPAELTRMCRQAGLEVLSYRGLTYNPLNKVYRLTNNIDVNYMIVCRKA